MSIVLFLQILWCWSACFSGFQKIILEGNFPNYKTAPTFILKTTTTIYVVKSYINN